MTTQYHCHCCHGSFDLDSDPNAWVSWLDDEFEIPERYAVCGLCNADGCSPGCYAFDFIPDVVCATCGNPVTEVQAMGLTLTKKGA